MKTGYQLICTTWNTDLTELEEAAQLSGMHPEMIEVFLRAGIVRSEADGKGVRYIGRDGIERLCQIQRMRKQRRPVLRYIRLVFALTDRLVKTERELQELRNLLSSRYPD